MQWFLYTNDLQARFLLCPAVSIAALHGVLILDAGIAKLVTAETRRVDEVGVRTSAPSHEADESEVIDFACDLKIFGACGCGGARVVPKGYSTRHQPIAC